MKKKAIIIILITLLSFTAITTYSRYTKTVSKTGTIATVDVGYCKNKNISLFSECLIRNDSQQELSTALSTIDTRTSSVDFSNVEPISTYIPKTKYTNITNKTNTTAIVSTTANRFTYVIESKLITEFDVDDTDITKITFDSSTGQYKWATANSNIGNINDIVTTATDIENGVYKYTCLNTTTTGSCTFLYLFTEEPYLVSKKNRFKRGYTYSYQVVGTSNSNSGLYKGEDDYTTYSESTPIDNFTYYYRGAVQNNWVSFGGFLWRVVRINGDGSIRMIYSGLESASSHTGTDAQIGATTFGDTSSRTAITTDITGLTNDTITTTYSNSVYGNTYDGYMYNPAMEIATYPNKNVGSANTPAGGYKLNNFPTFVNISDATNYYFFKNFNPSTDCFIGNGNDEIGACTLKCRTLGQDGDTGIDCIQSNWNTLATTTGNYSTTDPGVYSTQYIYKNNYKYTCWGYGTAVQHPNSDGTTSIYVTCPIVSEIIGTIKNQPTKAKVKYHGLFSHDAPAAITNVKDSNVKKLVDTWYENNILNANDGNGHSLENYISDEIFCNDRSSTSSSFPVLNNESSYIYGAYARNATNKIPSLKCPNASNDGFTLKTSGASSTVTPSGNGNNMLNYPIGLLTADEVVFAGGKVSTMNQKYYLYTGLQYYTMSPSTFVTSYVVANVYVVNSNGSMQAYMASCSYGIRPVINLKSNVLYSNGTGTEADPYIITIQ